MNTDIRSTGPNDTIDGRCSCDECVEARRQQHIRLLLFASKLPKPYAQELIEELERVMFR